MIRRPPRSTLTDTPFPYTMRFRSAGSRVLDLVLVVPDANANIEFVVDDAEPAACVPADAGIAPRLSRRPADAFSVEVAGDSDRTLSPRPLTPAAPDTPRLPRTYLPPTPHPLARPPTYAPPPDTQPHQPTDQP